MLISLTEEIDLTKALAKKLNIPQRNIRKIIPLRKSLDARKKNKLKYNFTLKAEIDFNLKYNHEVQKYKKPQEYIQSINKITDAHPFIIGSGPAGLFAALALVEKGFQPFIFERGDKIENRIKKVSEFWDNGTLDPESNAQFGEGGAGTFSDGKLTTRKNDVYTDRVAEYLIKFGADQNITYEALPHLGTDGLRKIILNIRNFLQQKNCKFYWNNKLENIVVEKNKVRSVLIKKEIYSPEIVILALGNSPRDTIEILSEIIHIENKPFAVGFRIEHKQDYLNDTFYGSQTDLNISGPATYRLTAQADNRGIYSFCMCPGGFVIGTASEENSVVTNGMSFANRESKFGNSAVVVTVNDRDYGKHRLAGLDFQRKIEKQCFTSSHPYFAPTQPAANFMKSLASGKRYETSYRPGTYDFDLNSIYPDDITNALKIGLKTFDKRAAGFIENGIFIAAETRTSSPVSIIRDHRTYSTKNVINLFPVGEGSGHAGGIMSSAVDGYKCGLTFYNSEK